MSILRALALTVAMLVMALGAAACGGDDDGNASPTPGSPTAESSGGDGQPTTPDDAGATPEPETTPTPAPKATPTPEPSAAPESSPTPAVLTFDTADAGGGTNTPKSAGPFGIVYSDASFAFNAAANRAQAVAFVNVGIQERPSASGWITNNFRVPGDGTAPVNTQVASEVNWQGVLAGNGAGGTRAAVTITLSVTDGERAIASETVHTREQRESLLTLGGFDDIGRENVDLQVALVPGVYQLRLTVTCEAGSGLIGVATHCIFGPSDTYDDGFVQWGARSILFAP